MIIRNRYNVAMIAVLVCITITGATSCNSSGTGASGTDSSFIKPEKPAVDTTRVPEMIELYRAKRYEDFQTAEAAGIEQVLKISFHGKKMGSLSSEIARFTYLATLDVSYNDLAELPVELSELYYLQGFYARGNNLTEFPEALLMLPLLARLDLSENQIAKIPAGIIHMNQLGSLNLEKNALSQLPVQVYELSNLSVLNLAHNGISRVPEGIGQMLGLQKLDLSNNQLNAIPEEIVALSGNLKELSIQGNQIPAEKVKYLVEAMPSTQIRY
jgi:Leucine rich repeat